MNGGVRWIAMVLVASVLAVSVSTAAEVQIWPASLKGAVDGTVGLKDGFGPPAQLSSSTKAELSQVSHLRQMGELPEQTTTASPAYPSDTYHKGSHGMKGGVTWIAMVFLASVLIVSVSMAEKASTWPPPLKGAVNGTVELTTELFLKVPEAVKAAAEEEGATAFEMAKTPPTVQLAYHGDLGPDAIHRFEWGAWGEIVVAGDGSVYCATGDHDNNADGSARAFIYRWDPKASVLKKICDLNEVAPRKQGQPAWSKVHAGIFEGPKGYIYFTGTLNNGQLAGEPEYKWSEEFPGGQIYRYDPKTGQAEVFVNLPPKRCTAATELDRDRGIFWCNLESGAGRDALWALDLETKQEVFRGPEGSVKSNRNFAIARDGAIYFNGKGGIWKYDPETNDIAPTGAKLGESTAIRASTRESTDGHIYGIAEGTNDIFRYTPATNEVKMLGGNLLTGKYVVVCVLSPDERFMYYLPGAHSKSVAWGSPLVQYEIATGTRKILAFMVEAFDEHYDYVVAGTYGIKMNEDGSVLYANFHGHAGDDIRPDHMEPRGFGLSSFAAIHIPESER